ncbi:MAG: site-specific DNA-methyltransferase [Bacteroidales bacterium]|nr:site-specific DNA-methyltransferase [Bacteroidales bacterium]
MNATKESLIAEIEKRVSDKILEQTNADLLIKLINNADTLDEAINIAALGTTYKRTGLHFDKRLEKMSDTIKYFKKNEVLSFHTDDNKPTHKLIIGDNYEALQNLLIQYRGKIDVIYIDPPYGKDSMGEFAATNYNNAITRDNLLSMLYPRLTLAKQLLSDEGVIFCSIDDKNQAYVKCLFDEVIGESNFIACAPRKTGAGDAATRSSSELRKPFDYLLIFKRGNDAELQKKIVGEKEYKYCDQLGNYKLDKFQASGSDATRKARPNLYYPIYVTKNKSLSLKETEDCIETILPQKVNGEDGRWMWKPEKFEKDKDDYLIYDGATIYRKTYYDEEQDQNIYQVEKAWIDGGEFRNAKGTSDLSEIIGKNMFNNPKPIALVEWCINLVPKKEKQIILDFFAGSATTGHAVLDLNRSEAKDSDLLEEEVPEGNRTFILCQLNENLDEALKSAIGGAKTTIENQIALCDKIGRPHELSEITAERVRRVMLGSSLDGTKDFEWIKKNKPYGGNLDVYEIESVSNFEWTEGKTPFDVIDETIYGKEKFANIKEKIEWVCGNFDKTQKYLEQQKREE